MLSFFAAYVTPETNFMQFCSSWCQVICYDQVYKNRTSSNELKDNLDGTKICRLEMKMEMKM